MPLTSFRFQLAMDPLVSLAGQFPLLGPVRDLHPLADIHASQTKKGIWLLRTISHFLIYLYEKIVTIQFRPSCNQTKNPEVIPGIFCIGMAEVV